MGCIWVYSARIESYSYKTWVVRNGLIDEPRSRIYLAAMYWAITSITTVGYGDIHA